MSPFFGRSEIAGKIEINETLSSNFMNSNGNDGGFKGEYAKLAGQNTPNKCKHNCLNI